jgi:hypothetical protein
MERKRKGKEGEIKHEKQNMRFVFEGDTDFDAVAWTMEWDGRETFFAVASIFIF